jgi:quercetin dioxygenase-like cupin family protein
VSAERQAAPEPFQLLADGVLVNAYTFPERRTVVPQHAHALDHISYIAHGAAHAWVDGEYRGIHVGPCGLFIPAGVKHAFLTEQPGTVLLCIHNLHGEKAVRVLAEHELTVEDAVELVRPILAAGGV